MTTTGNQRTAPTQAADLDQLLAEYVTIMPALDQAQARIAVGLWRLLAEGAPVAPQALAERLGVSVQDVAATLDGVLAGTRHEDDQGRVIAFWALSLPEMPSPHRLQVDGQTLYAWCAPDTLWLPRVLGKTATVQSALETTGQPISLVVRPDGIEQVSVDGAVLSFVRAAGKSLGDTVPAVLSSYCHHQLFFPSKEAGGRWAQAQGRDDIALFTIEETVDGAHRFIDALVGTALDPR
jgi:alkylmercury lyase